MYVPRMYKICMILLADDVIVCDRYDMYELDLISFVFVCLFVGSCSWKLEINNNGTELHRESRYPWRGGLLNLDATYLGAPVRVAGGLFRVTHDRSPLLFPSLYVTTAPNWLKRPNIIYRTTYSK